MEVEIMKNSDCNDIVHQEKLNVSILKTHFHEVEAIEF